MQTSNLFSRSLSLGVIGITLAISLWLAMTQTSASLFA